MKKIASILITAAWMISSGCTLPRPVQSDQPRQPKADWVIYTDPAGQFQFSYPPEWTQVDTTSEIQLWDNFDDGVNSIKMALVSEPRTLEAIRSARPEDRGPSSNVTFHNETINHNPVLVEVGTSGASEFRTYYYSSGEKRSAFTAWFHDKNDEIRQNALTVQQSFRFLETD